jgi:hypothetical protein
MAALTWHWATDLPPCAIGLPNEVIGPAALPRPRRAEAAPNVPRFWSTLTPALSQLKACFCSSSWHSAAMSRW